MSKSTSKRPLDYACCDVETCWRLVPVLRRKLEENKLKELYESNRAPAYRSAGAHGVHWNSGRFGKSWRSFPSGSRKRWTRRPRSSTRWRARNSTFSRQNSSDTSFSIKSDSGCSKRQKAVLRPIRAFWRNLRWSIRSPSRCWATAPSQSLKVPMRTLFPGWFARIPAAFTPLSTRQ